MMLKVILLCLAVASAVAQNNNSTGNQGNTRIFGLGNLISGLTGNRPNRPNRPFNGGFNNGFNSGFNPGFNQGFNQGGFNQGFNPGFNQGFNQGGFNQGGFNQLGNLVGGLAASFLGGRPNGFRPPFNGGFNQFKPGRCPAVRPQCPNTRFGGPQVCSSDFSCAGSDKCCFDTCLRERVCKPIVNFG